MLFLHRFFCLGLKSAVQTFSFKQTVELSHVNIEGNLNSIIRRFINCFFSAYVKSVTTERQTDKKKVKKRRIGG